MRVRQRGAMARPRSRRHVATLRLVVLLACWSLSAIGCANTATEPSDSTKPPQYAGSPEYVPPSARTGVSQQALSSRGFCGGGTAPCTVPTFLSDLGIDENIYCAPVPCPSDEPTTP